MSQTGFTSRGNILTYIWNLILKVWYWFFPKKYKTVKPSGTVSMISNQSQGIEPVFKTHYIRDIK